MYVKSLDVATVSTIFLQDFGMVQTVCYFLFDINFLIINIVDLKHIFDLYIKTSVRLISAASRSIHCAKNLE